MDEAAAGTISAPAAPSPAEAARGGGVLHVALIGNPNTGKSTLFNALTGMRQRVGNYSGVTVERVEGRYRDDAGSVTVIDLPGTYSLSASSPDEEIALAVLTGHAPGIDKPDVVVVVVDAANLERNLFLASQVLELGLPAVVALNQVDAAEAAGMRIDAVELTLELGAPVVPMVATRGQGLDVLRSAVRKAAALPRPERAFTLPAEAEQALGPVRQRLTDAGFNPSAAAMEALRLLAVREVGRHLAAVPGLQPAVDQARAEVESAGLSPISLEAEARYGWIADVVDRTVARASGSGGKTFTDRVDAVALHRVGGPVIFVVLMALVFQSIFTWAEPLIGWVEGLFGALGGAVASAIPPGDLQSLVVDGVIAGVGSVLVFLPQITILFLFIGILEDTGYMARAAFIMDRFMRSVGLHGRSFIPMLSGYACAVPGIMATRTIESRKDRLATIMVLPLMSCSARIPIYTLLIGTFIPPVVVGGIFNLQGMTLLGMYLLGTVTALVVASIFKRTLLKGQARPMIMELPPYRLPRIRSLALSVGHRASMFLKKAGTIILALSILLWALATYPKSEPAAGLTEQQAQESQLANSALGRMGHAVEPLVAPLGYDWKIGVGILSSFAAREVFVATMGTIYGVGSDATEESTGLRDQLRAETHRASGAPVYTPLVAVGLMVFYVYAMMCMSTAAVVVRETGGGWTGIRWAGFQFAWMLALAYLSALLVYQGGRLLGWG